MLVYLTPCAPLRKQERGNRLASPQRFALQLNLVEALGFLEETRELGSAACTV